MVHVELDPIDERFAPLAAAIGRAVLGAAALEKILLVDLAQRYAERDGMRAELERELSRLEQKPAGALLATLRELGIPNELAARLGEFIARRNDLVHHFMEKPEVLVALASSGPFDELVDGVDALAAECQRLINEIAPLAFAGAEKALGATLPELVEAAKLVDPESVEDERLRALLTVATLNDSQSPGSKPGG